MELNKQTIRKLLGIIVFTLIGCWLLLHSDRVWEFIKYGMSMFTPFIIGLCIAFVINMLLRPIERLWKQYVKGRYQEKLKRTMCLIISSVVIVGVLFILLFMVVPELKRTIVSIIEIFPDYMDQVSIWWKDASVAMSDYGINLPELNLDNQELQSTITTFFSESGSHMFNKTVDVTTTIFTSVFHVVLGVVFAFYVLFQKEALSTNVLKCCYAYLPEQRVNQLLDFMRLCDQTFTKFVTGQLLESVIIGVLCLIGMLILRIPYAVMISVMVGFTALIPVFGALIGTGVGAILIVMVDPMKAIWFIIFIIVLQQLEGDLIYPKVVGKSVGLPSIWVLIAVTIGASFGVKGMLLSVPICSVLYCIVKTVVHERLKHKRIDVLSKRKQNP